MNEKKILNRDKFLFAKIPLLFFFCLLPLNGALAKHYSAPLEYETIRTRGMGGISIAVADDHQALFTNPAGLFQISKHRFAVANADGEINQDFRRVKNKTSGLSDEDTPENRARNNAILSGIMGQRARTLVSNLAYYLGTKGFGVGFLYQALAEIDVFRPTNPHVRTYGVIDSVLLGSLCKPIPRVRVLFQDKALGWWGVSLKFLSRQFLDRAYYARDFASLNEDVLRSQKFKGETLDVDGGTFWQLNNTWNQSVGLAVTSVLETEIDPMIGNLKRRVDLGTTVRPLSGPYERNRKLLLGADIYDLFGKGSFLKHLRLGAEAIPWKWLSLRGGVRGGYLSAGFTARFRVVRLEFATYSEEIGPRPGDREDRRYSANFGIEF